MFAWRLLVSMLSVGGHMAHGCFAFRLTLDRCERISLPRCFSSVGGRVVVSPLRGQGVAKWVLRRRLAVVGSVVASDVGGEGFVSEGYGGWV